MKKWLLGVLCVLGIVSFAGAVVAEPVMAATDCTSILGSGECDDMGEETIWGILGLVLNIVSGGVGIAAVVGIVVSGIQYMSARDNEGQVTKAKSRIFNIVIGLVCYAVMWAVLNWLMPGGLFNAGT